MKVMLVTTPIRPTPTSFPPIGSLSIINYLRKRAIEVDFYHIDGMRPDYNDALAHIMNSRPDVLGISAVVSTAYSYTKKLAEDVKAALPDTLIVVGGSLAASAEILLRRASIDLCALGEGEIVFHHVVERARTTRTPADFHDIPGLALLDANGKLINTGYETQLGKEDIYNVDWRDLEAAADIAAYIYPAFNKDKVDFWFERDPRSYEAHRRAKSVASLPTAKGCVARCTFCHRWDKGIRYIPAELIKERVRELVERYNVGFLHIADENFGTDRRWLKQICDILKPFDILWNVAGMRVNCISPEQINMMKDAGCVAILYGMETGSERMLQVMEKKVKIEDNYNAIRWTVDANLNTVVQLVIGMPGENSSTIKETIRFSTYANTINESQRPWDLSINYAQALPGTPLYEFGRHKGLIGSSLEEEEKYLIQISDRDASDEFTTMNFTESPFFIHRSWRQAIQLSVSSAYIRKYGKRHYSALLLADTRYFDKPKKNESGYFNKPKLEVEKTLLSDTIHDTRQVEIRDDNPALPSMLSLIRQRKLSLLFLCYPEVFVHVSFLLPVLWFIRGARLHGLHEMLVQTSNWLGRAKSGRSTAWRSLRKIVQDDLPPLAKDDPAMESLRRGR